jgi:hypothetical protein
VLHDVRIGNVEEIDCACHAVVSCYVDELYRASDGAGSRSDVPASVEQGWLRVRRKATKKLLSKNT